MIKINDKIKSQKIWDAKNGVIMPNCQRINFWLEDFSGAFYTPDKPLKKFVIKNNMSIHYVLSGSGFFFVEDKAYHLKKGDAFLILPFDRIKYYPDKNEPWCYCGISSNSKEVASQLCTFDITKSMPIFKEKAEKIGDIFSGMIEDYTNDTLSDFKMSLALLNLLSGFEKNITVTTDKTDEYVQKAISYIKENMSDSKLTVEDISDSINLSHSYLCRIFKEKVGKSPKRFLVDIRIDAAARLLKTSVLSVSEIAFDVGFDDIPHFIKSFRKRYNITPKQYRKEK